MNKITKEEKRLLNILIKEKGNPVKGSVLQRRLNVDRRKLSYMVEALRSAQYAVGSTRRNGGGYYVITTEDRRKETIKPYQQQINKMTEIVNNLKESELIKIEED